MQLRTVDNSSITLENLHHKHPNRETGCRFSRPQRPRRTPSRSPNRPLFTTPPKCGDSSTTGLFKEGVLLPRQFTGNIQVRAPEQAYTHIGLVRIHLSCRQKAEKIKS